MQSWAAPVRVLPAYAAMYPDKSMLYFATGMMDSVLSPKPL